MPDVTGFWSYVQADDLSDGGRILSLAAKLRDQYRLLTADELAVFVDRESLEWGSEWSKRIDDAIAGTTFFIPIITPSYFKSRACRNELLKFAREASRLGLEQLLMPVYWVTVTELESEPESSADEAIKLVSRYQWQDLREVRLEDEHSSAFRKAVSRLAGELGDRAAKVTETVHDAPGDGGTVATGTGVEYQGDDEPGILDKMAASEDAFPRLNEIMDELSTEIEKVGDLVSVADERMQKANARSQGIKANLTITEKLARELGDPAEAIERVGHRYAETLGELDPGLHALLDVAATDNERTPEEDAERAEFLRGMQELAATADRALGELDSMVQGAREMATFSRSLRAPLRRIGTGIQGVLDGRALIEEWGRRAAEIERNDRDAADERPQDPRD